MMGKYKIIVRKISNKHWAVGVHYGYGTKESECIYFGYEDSWEPALSRGHEEAEKHYDALLEHAFDDDYGRE